MNLITNPETSRQAAEAIQGMDFGLRDRFIEALRKAKKVSDLPPIYQDYLKNGYKTDKVSMPDDDIWDNLEFEWIEE